MGKNKYGQHVHFSRVACVKLLGYRGMKVMKWYLKEKQLLTLHFLTHFMPLISFDAL